MDRNEKHDPRTAPKRMRKLDEITVQRVRCPQCGGIKLLRYRSVRDQGDGSASAYVRCAEPECGHRFRLVME